VVLLRNDDLLRYFTPRRFMTKKVILIISVNLSNSVVKAFLFCGGQDVHCPTEEDIFEFKIFISVFSVYSVFSVFSVA